MSHYPQTPAEHEACKNGLRRLMAQLRALMETATDPEVRSELQEEMCAVANNWVLYQMEVEEEKAAQQAELQLIARTHQSPATSRSPAQSPPRPTETPL